MTGGAYSKDEMADPSPDTIAYWLSREVSNLSFRTLLDVTLDVLAVHLTSRSQEERAEFAEKLTPRIIESLERIASESREDGIEPTFELSSEANTAYFRAIESSASQLLSRLLQRSPAEFETFCTEALRRLGGVCTVTGRSGDGGVDFVARDLIVSAGQGPAPIGARVLVLGQAKRYNRDNLVAEGELRSFVGGAIQKASDHGDSVTFRRAILAPVIFAFWTTSDFHPSAKRYARSVGLWYLNGIALAQLAIRLGLTVGFGYPTTVSVA
jgi:restriction endonuclease Mrr